MGLFSSKKTYVASTLYNLAGPELDRPNYLKSVITSSIIGEQNFSIADVLQQSYINGPGIRFRNFFRWALANYDEIGVPTGNLGGAMSLDLTVVAGEVPFDPGETVKLQTAEVGIADYSYWADQWMLENEPTLIDTEWTSDIDEVTGDITITFEDTTEETFTPVGFDKDKVYLYAAYNVVTSGSPGPVVTGSTTTITPATDPFPSTVGYTLDSNTTDAVSDAPNVIETWVWTKTIYQGQDDVDDFTYSLKSDLYLIEKRDPMAVVIDRSWRIDTQEITDQIWSEARIWIYEVGSGNTVIDDLIVAETNEGEYLPFIPLRLDNEWLSDTFEPDGYAISKKAMRKTGASIKYDDLMDKVKESEDVDKFDYVYVMYGVPLNVLDRSSREYLYRFFDKCRLSQTVSNIEYALFQSQLTDFDTSNADWNAWKLAQSDPLDPLFGTAEPTITTRPAGVGNYVQILSNGDLPTNVNMKISWQMITFDEGTGEGQPGAKKGDVWLESVADAPGSDTIYSGHAVYDRDRVEGTFTITWQDTTDSWKKLTVIGAQHENLIYKKKSVTISAKEALEDAEESGFLVPMHYATVREMSLISSTQMQTACTYIVINTYKVVKTGFFGSLFFKIFIFIAIIAITVLTMGAGTAPAVGILGSAAAVGAALGFSGVVAIIVGTIVNSIAAMIIMKILQAGATAVFGAKIGAIIGAIVAVVAVTVGGSLLNGGSLTTAFNSLTSAQGLLALTNAATNGVGAYLQASAMEYAQKTQELQEEYGAESKRISSLFQETFGSGNALFDPLSLTESTFGKFTETQAAFLSRTLMTGTDIAELTKDLLNNFARYTITTDLPLNAR